jgi:hypothetical protein
MKHKRLFVVLLFASLACAAQTSTHTKAEIFGGYQYTHPDGGPNLNGWNGALTGNFNKSFGITADFSGAYGSGGSVYTYAVGPKVSAGDGTVRPFVHALFGGVRVGGPLGSTTGFGMMFGGGLDVGRGRLAWRVVQGDWLITRFSGFTDKKNVRVSTGLVLRF